MGSLDIAVDLGLVRMWLSLVKVAVCVFAIIHAASPLSIIPKTTVRSTSSRGPITPPKTTVTSTTSRGPITPPSSSTTPKRYCCSEAPCGGVCVRGYCKYPDKQLISSKCTCPSGMRCCKRITTRHPCEKCNSKYKCVPKSVYCASPVSRAGCTCPKEKKCCKGPFCFECGGRCKKGKCKAPFYPIFNYKCPCPRGMSCCKRAGCGSRGCRYARCLPSRAFCPNVIRGTRCSCPPYMKCCRYTCELAGCRGKCVKGYKCPQGSRLNTKLRFCTCPKGYSCCSRICPYLTTTRVTCRRLGGWLIPGRGVPPLICCRLPTCAKNCKAQKAKCALSRTCRFKIRSSNCLCRPGLVCCKYTCELARCKGKCVRGRRCPEGLKKLSPNSCTCPVGYSCCWRKCPYRTRTYHNCRRLGGWVIPATGVPKGHVCCQLPTCVRNCKGQKAGCASRRSCKYVIKNSRCLCRPNLVCCMYTCGFSPCGGKCIRSRGFPKGWRPHRNTCTCPPGYKCCSPIGKCRHKPMNYFKCRRLGGWVIPASGNPKGFICCKLPTCASNCRAQKARCASKLTCRYPIKSSRCSCRPGLVCCRYSCNMRGCRGKCYRGRCPIGWRQHRYTCTCPFGSSCCSPFGNCPYPTRTYANCKRLGGWVIPASGNPKGRICCKLPTCARNCKAHKARCAPSRMCRYPIKSPRCSCRPGLVCCKYSCELAGCRGKCIRGQCPRGMRQLSGRTCTCPGGYSCCSRKCPYLTTTYHRCKQLGGWVIPATGNPVGRVCCKLPTCARNCRAYKAGCATMRSCIYKIRTPRCSCRPGLVCCRYTCELGGCRGKCVRGLCPRGMRQLNSRTCTCPLGYSCCSRKCPYPTRSILMCIRLGGWPIPATGVPKGRVCCKLPTCKYNCKVYKARCAPIRMCRYPIKSPRCTCRPGLVCCKYTCELRGCNGECIRGRRCPNGRRPLRNSCTCPAGYSCCKRIGKCPYPTRTYAICKRLGGWVIPASGNPKGRICCKLPTCARNCRAQKARCALNRTCRYPIRSQRCSCRPGLVCCQYTCELRGCNGKCIKGRRCPNGRRPLRNSCTCPAGYSCCKIIKKCPYRTRTYLNCRRLGGWTIPASGVPLGRVCCKLPTCVKNCRAYRARCTPKRNCKFEIKSSRCSCRPGLVCCKYTCELRGCKGKCFFGRRCPTGMRQLKRTCTCPVGYSCCYRRCPYPTRTYANCKRLGGWVIPVSNNPKGRVCCKLPTCARNCKIVKAQCASRRSCRYPLITSRCTCRPGLVCCKYTCELAGCKGKCLRGRCPKGWRPHRGTCTCPLGYSCCSRIHKCPHATLPILVCLRLGGWVIPASGNPRGRVCCKLPTCAKNCRAQKAGCTLKRLCRYKITSSRCYCRADLVCCKYTCELRGCGGRCIRGRRCPTGSRLMNMRSCTCPLGYACCTRIPKCPYLTRTYSNCRRLGGWVIPASGNPKGRVCCKLPTCARNCRAHKARCAPTRMCRYPIRSLRCSCRPGQVCCRYTCELRGCKGKCIRGRRCPTGLRQLSQRTCTCPLGYSCCHRNCPYRARTYISCRLLGGWLIPATNNPAGRVCCKLPTCARNCRAQKARCALKRTCRYPIRSPRCSCRPGLVCCKYTCELRGCRGRCNRGRCPKGTRPARNTCTCPAGYSCCIQIKKCPYPTMTYIRCRRLGGWVIPAKSNPKGRVCCKLPTCKINCKVYKARCVRSRTCKYPIKSPRCTCRPGLVCCRYTCELSGCKGKCIKGGCPNGRRPLQNTCTCPAGYSCCSRKCPYTTRTYHSCRRLGGWVIPASGNPRGRVCCKLPTCARNCRANKARCASSRACRYPIKSPRCTCRPGLVCCKYTCELLGCRGKCVRGRCPNWMRQLSQRTCTCPVGYSCCARKCPYPTRTIAWCRRNRGWVIPATGVPKGRVCCKLPTCARNCKAQKARCVPKRTCRHIITSSRCSCRPGLVCCRYTCELAGCRGKCVRGRRCPKGSTLKRRATCTCPIGQSCCTRIRKCPYPTRTYVNCRRLGGWVIPARGNPPGRVCCKLPTCSKNCRLYKARCVPRRTCLFPITTSRCSCRPGLVCCKYTCELRGCKGKCVRGRRCPPGSKLLNRKSCTCPIGHSCCTRIPKCPYRTRTYTNCRRLGGWVIPASGNPRGRVCCKLPTCAKNCRAQKARCEYKRYCKYVIPTPRCACRPGLVCCRFTCETRSCKGQCVKGRRCPKGTRMINRRSCTCPNNHSCCTRLPKCPYRTRTYVNCRRLGGWVIPASGNPKGRVCCKLPTCARNCRAQKAQCAPKHTCIYKLRTPRCSCRPGLVCCKYTCGLRGCKGKCIKGRRCPKGSRPLNKRRCTCPRGYLCCSIIAKCPYRTRTYINCRRLGGWVIPASQNPKGRICCKLPTCARNCRAQKAKCAPKLTCRNKIYSSRCSCRRGLVCCKYTCELRGCRGICVRGRRCPKGSRLKNQLRCTCPIGYSCCTRIPKCPYRTRTYTNCRRLGGWVIPASGNPRGRVCCKLPTCAKNCRALNARCVPPRTCIYKLKTSRCTCRPGLVCCKYTCGLAGCRGKCVRGRRCPKGSRLLNQRRCTCPTGSICCTHIKKCPYPTRTYANCRRLGGWVIPASGNPKGRVCCKLPKCAIKCRAKKARCAPKRTCRYPIKSEICSCRPGLVCCKYTCELGGCRGKCVSRRLRCPRGTTLKKKTSCTCPIGYSCCTRLPKCPYPTIPYAICRRLGGWVIPASGVPRGRVCCKLPTCASNCRAQKARCVPWRTCKHKISSSRCSCRPGLVCCKYTCELAGCRGKCIRGRRCPKGSRPLIQSRCTCPIGYLCCSIIHKCPYPTRTYSNCRRLGGWVIPATNNPKGRVCCKLPTCARNCRSHKAQCALSLTCRYKIKSPRCSCRPGLVCCRYTCEQGGCKGKCVRGRRCPKGSRPLNQRRCTCPIGYLCCTRIQRCPHRTRTYINCRRLGGWVIPASNNPKGRVCCKLPTCARNCKAYKARCASSRTCRYPIRSPRCSCRPGLVCCKYTCELSGCRGNCVRGRRCPGGRRRLNGSRCTCPSGYLCCSRIPKCPYPTVPYAFCRRLGGWVIPASGNPKGRVCCKFPTCARNCKALKARCAPKQTCKYPIKTPKCSCRPGLVCCKYTCELSGCKGKCVRGRRCPKGSRLLNQRRCTCPIGYSCCTRIKKCPYRTRTYINCRRLGGWVIPATGNPKGRVCCKLPTCARNCRAQKARCAPKLTCIYKLNKSRCTCRPGLVCCRYTCEQAGCKGICIKGRRCPKGSRPLNQRRCTCPRGYLCCTRINKCPYRTRTYINCRRLGGWVIPATGNPKGRICCKLPTCARNCRAQKARCAPKRSCRYKINKSRCTCRPGLVCCRYTCELRGCRGICVRGRRCPTGSRRKNPKFCTCPIGYSCCTRIPKCPYRTRTYRNCRRLGGWVIPASGNPKGHVCCKLPTCARNCRAQKALCAPMRTCIYKLKTSRCTCRPGLVCCKYTCELSGCRGKCVKGRRCPKGSRPLNQRRCTCPRGYLCCTRILKCPYPTRTYRNCRRLGGWVIPATGNPKGRVCCKLPTCARNCRAQKAGCAPKLTCRYKLNKSRCTCRPGLVCCMYTCELRGCRGKCVRGRRCPKASRPLNQRRCTCPIGYLCCSRIIKCPYPTRTYANCRRLGGWVISASGNPKGIVCCKLPTCARNCKRDKAQCASKRSCRYPIKSSRCSCRPGLVCCKHSCELSGCKGKCVRGLRCPKGSRRLNQSRCTCPRGYLCCTRIRKCPYPTRTYANCRRLGGWVIPASGNPKGRVCCRLPTCASNCRAQKARCVPWRTCKHKINSSRCSCRPGLVCCKYTCELRGCKGKCQRGSRCPPGSRRIKRSACTCPLGYSCCTRILKCPYPTRTYASCRRLGGWVIPASGNPKGHVCCKFPTCARNCKAFKARCAPRLSCRYKLDRFASRCSCKPGQVCCRYTCEQGGCKGKCVRGPCRGGMTRMNPNACTCPLGYSCCKIICPYKPCLRAATCRRYKGLVIPAWDCARGKVCCKGTCPCPHKCVSALSCKLKKGTPIPSSDCRRGHVCCRGKK
ncbi:zonadhesin-like [Lineus longissimus]|uniref:zonadhesin-like n=1 Tax=Lineus longissimus TaxID=88925 RepID=UPI00315D9CB0